MTSDNSPTRLTDPDDIFGRPGGRPEDDDDAGQPTRFTPLGDARQGPDDPPLGETMVTGSEAPPLDDDDDDDLEQTQIAGGQGDDSIVPGFRVMEKLGEGGMGVVYKAIQSSLNRTVALKIVKKALSSQADFVKRFRREALAAAKLNHPNIVSIFDYGIANGVAFMALEYVEGRNCQSVARKQAIDQELGLRVIRDCVLGLSHAYSHGLIHRDIKPANIMMVEKGAQDARGQQGVTAKVLDLGLAKNDKSENPELRRVTQIGLVLGTPEHMSPEQALGHDIDFRCDIYALGSSLYFMLTTRLPFTGSTAIELMNKKINGEAINPQDIVPDIDDSTIRVLDKMMAKRPVERYASYEELLQDVEALLRGEEPKATAVPKVDSSIASRLRSRALSSGKKKVKKKKAGTSRGFLIAVAAVLVLGVGLSWYFGSRQGAQSAGRNGPAFTPPPAEEIAAAVKSLDDLYQRSKYDEMASLLARISEPWTKAERELPPNLERFQSIFKQAMLDDRGNKERMLRAQVDAATDPQVIADLLTDFETRYPFSPAIPSVQQRRAKALSEIESSRQRAEIESRAVDFVRQLNTLAPEVLITELEKQRTTLETHLANAELAEDFKTARRADFSTIILDQLSKLLPARLADLEKLWRSGEWTGLAKKCADVSAPYELMKKAIPSEIERYRGYAEAANKDGAGLAEREAWSAAKALRDDPIALAGALSSFATRFPFSPEVEEAKRLVEAAEKDAPPIEIETEPSGAEIKVDGRVVGKSKWNGRLKRGKARVSLHLDGYQDIVVPLEHKGGASHFLRLSPLPQTVLVQGNTRRNIALALKPFMEWRKVGIWTQAEDGESKPVIQGESESDTWVIASVDTDTIPQKARIFKDSQGWLLKLFIDRASGDAEVRVLQSANGDAVVLGFDGGGLYFGTRDAATKALTPWAVAGEVPKKVAYIAVEWHGDVARFIFGYETNDAITVGAIRPPWTPATPGLIEFAVKNGTSKFGDAEMFPLYEKP